MTTINKLGFHYIPDTNHYRKSDLDTWLPRLKALKAHWLVLKAPFDRAIPELFLHSLLDAQIEPVLHFDLLPDRLIKVEELNFLFQIYGKWGVRYITLFNKPNLRRMWKTINWVQTDLVERFLDTYLPLAENCIANGLIPIFPPLEPGGDYWDTVFLRGSLQGMKRRGHFQLLDALVVGAIARSNGHHLNWGVGGPERWPGVIPYTISSAGEDHQGFRIFDWYKAITQSVIVKSRPIFLFEVEPVTRDDIDYHCHTKNCLAIAHLLAGKAFPDIEILPDEVIGSAFWYLADSTSTGKHQQAWFNPQNEHLPIVQTLQDWIASEYGTDIKISNGKHIPHYLLLPSFEGEVSDYYIDSIRPLIKKYKLTIGFSVNEAKHAERVTVFDTQGSFPEATIDDLRNAGCVVHQIEEIAQTLQF